MPQNDLTFEAPGPGPWMLDNQHVPIPMSRFRAEYFDNVITESFSKSMADWGDFTYMVRVMINGFSYGQESRIGADPGSSRPGGRGSRRCRTPDTRTRRVQREAQRVRWLRVVRDSRP